MSNPLIMLVLQLVGAALVFVALAMLLGRAGHGGGSRRTAGSFATLAIGVGLTTMAWVMRDGPPDSVSVGNAGPEQFERMLTTNPTAAGSPRFEHVGVVVDSTPNDRGNATPSARHAYSSQLATVLANALVTAGLSANADAQAMPTSNWPGLPKPDYCAERDLLVTLRMPAVKLVDRDDYALWREPELEIRWCRTGKVQTQKFRVLERPGDTIPYAQAVETRLLAAVRVAPQP